VADEVADHGGVAIEVDGAVGDGGEGAQQVAGGAAGIMGAHANPLAVRARPDGAHGGGGLGQGVAG
jgi:hypothetical protein